MDINVATKVSFQGLTFALKIAEAGEQAQSFCNLLETVFHDYVEANTQFETAAIQAHLKSHPKQRLVIEDKLRRMTRALDNLVGILEPYRAEFETTGKLSFGKKVEWVLRLEGKAVAREKELSACHRSVIDHAKHENDRGQTAMSIHLGNCGGQTRRGYGTMFKPTTNVCSSSRSSLA